MSTTVPTSPSRRPHHPTPRLRLLDRIRLLSLRLAVWADELEGLTDHLERLVKVFERLVHVVGRFARLAAGIIVVIGIVALRLSGVF
jgi:hypothetical protein